MNGLYIALPLLGSAYIELREQRLGVSVVRYPQDMEIFLWRVQITLSKRRARK